MKTPSIAALALLLAAGASASQAAVHTIDYSGSVGGFSESQLDFQGLHFDNFDVSLTPVGGPVTVALGDMVNSTVTFDGAVTIPTAPVRTDYIQELSGATFPAGDTGVSGVFNFYDGATLVRTLSYGSSTSGELAPFATSFSPNNTPFTFDHFTDDFTITKLATPATVDGGSFRYSLVSPGLPAAVPEPATWSLMITGLGLAGGALRRRVRLLPMALS